MAERGAENNFRTSTQVVPEQQFQDTSVPLVETFAEIGKTIIKQGQEAKINENFSNAQVEVNSLNRQFQIDYAHDPFNKEGLERLKQLKADVYQKNASGISPFFKRPYDDAVRKLDRTSDATLEAFGYTQTRKNTVTSMNKAIQNSLMQAAIDGEGGADLGKSLLNFTASKTALVNTADGILSEPESTAMLESFNQDYLKTYLSGKAVTDPVGALQVLDSDEVKGSFKDAEQYSAMKKAVKSRALKVQQVAIENNVINNLKGEIGAFKSGKPLSYAELQVASEKMSKPAREFFMKKSGFSGKEKKLDPAEKLEVKARLAENFANVMSKESITVYDMAALQDDIFKAMNSGVLSEEQSLDLLNGMIEPTLADKEKQISTDWFDSGDWNPVFDNVGLPVIKEFYNNNVLIKSPEAEGAVLGGIFLSDEEKEVGIVSKTLNNTNKANLYNYYFDALQDEAAQKGIKVAQLNDYGSRSERRAIYERASDKAISDFRANTMPLALRTELPIAAVRKLMAHPDKADDFDKKFGTGAANRILGR